MGIRGEPAPNTYKLPTTVGYRSHDPTRWRDPAYTMGIKSQNKSDAGLGPGMYNVSNKTRFDQSRRDAGITIGAKVPDLYDYSSPGPVCYKHEKCNTKQSAPKFTMGSRTPIVKPQYVPSANTYKLPSTIGPNVPDKHCNGAFTIGQKMKTPRLLGVPGPNWYGPVKTDLYKQSGAKFTMGRRVNIVVDKAQKPAPNTYKPSLIHKLSAQKFQFGKRNVDSRIIYFTLDDIKK